MQITIRTSENNKEVIRKLTQKLGDGTPENVIARIALAYSIQSGKKFQTSEFSKYDSKGKEYKDHILFDPRTRDFYVALICQHYGIYKTNENIPRYIKLHIDHGLEEMGILFESNNYTFFDFLNEHIEKGIRFLSDINVTAGTVRNQNQTIQKSYFSGPIKIEIGKDTGTGESIILSLNDSTKYNNCHIAVAGNSGTGKTQFALDIISQIYENSNGQVNYIYLDFKGLKQDDVKEYSKFFGDTQTDFVDVPKRKIPVNPLTFIDNINESDKRMGIDKFVDIICKYSNLGQKQTGALRQATNDAFFDQKDGTYPTLLQIQRKLTEIYDKQDSLTEIMDALCRYQIFEDDTKNELNFLNKNLYLSLSGDLPKNLRFTSLFLVINYIYNVFMNMENTPTEENTKALRYVIIIDEAHVLFKEKKYEEILESMLREIRSKGVSIILLSQGIEEYNQQGFDFSSMCEIALLLDIKDKNNTKAMEKFLGLSGKHTTAIVQSMSKIKKGQAISNINEFEKAKLFKVSQYWERKD